MIEGLFNNYVSGCCNRIIKKGGERKKKKRRRREKRRREERRKNSLFQTLTLKLSLSLASSLLTFSRALEGASPELESVYNAIENA